MANLSHLARMLVVEDEAIILLDIESTLRDTGVADVVTATTIAGAMNALDRNRIDAAILDLHLGPNNWTYDIAHRLQAAGVPFVFSSGSAAVAEGFADVPLVTKPFSADQLIAALLEVTAGQVGRDTMRDESGLTGTAG